jgi:hypothetical protein
MSMPNEFPPPPGECNETSGFLFKHRCGNFAKNECGECRKAMCERHTVISGAMTLCTSCARTRMQSSGGAYPASSPYGHDPYFYGHSYYPGYYYGHYGVDHDFTSGDERRLHGGEPDARDIQGLGSDMSAS